MIVPLTESPVQATFDHIASCPVDRLHLSSEERKLLLTAEEMPTEYTLADQNDAQAYAQVLLKVLKATSSRSDDSNHVSTLTEPLENETDIRSILTADPAGVWKHYAIAKLYEMIVCLLEGSGRSVSIGSIFYLGFDGSLLSEQWMPLIQTIQLGRSGDSFAKRGAAICLAWIVVEACLPPRLLKSTSKRRKQQHRLLLRKSSIDQPLEALISWISSQLQSSTTSVTTSLFLVSPTLFILMSVPEARNLFNKSGGIGYISKHLRTTQTVRNGGVSAAVGRGKPTIQQQYELCFCLWTLTYELNDSAAVRMHFLRDGAIPALVDLVKQSPREKVLRVALLALVQLGRCSSYMNPSQGGKDVDGGTFLSEMIGCGLMRHVDLLMERQFADLDLVGDLKWLHRMLHDNFREMTRWDLYKAEVTSGQLEWGILHTEKFFQEHTRRMEDDNFNIVKRLICLISTYPDEETAAVACFDIGEFVVRYPNGRSIARQLGARNVILPHIRASNFDLQQSALQAISKLLVKNWSTLEDGTNRTKS